MNQNYYKILGVRRDATSEQIRSAYRSLAQRFHPDKNVAFGETELFLDVQSAYEILIDPERRAEYDSTLPVENDEPPPIKVTTTYSRSTITQIDDPQLIYVLLEMVPESSLGKENAPPLNLSLVLDVSTSMQGRVLDTVKSTAIKLIRELRTEDIISIVTFSDRADVLIPASRSRDPKTIETNIQMLTTSGGTEIYQGLEKGYSEISRYLSDKSINHIILITDGRTYGDEEECLNLARQAAAQSIGISALGIGNKWNDEFADDLTGITGGNSIFISKATEILYFLTEKFTGIGQRFAHNVKFSFNLMDGVELRYAYRLQPESTPIFIESPVVLGSVPNNSGLQVLFEFMLQGLSNDVGDKEILDGTISMDIPGSISPKISLPVYFDRPSSVEYSTDMPPQIIVEAMSKLTLYRMQERARHELTDGEKAKAIHKLQQLATQLLARGEGELARSVLEEVSSVQQNDRLTEYGEKRIKYGTRNLFLPENL